MPFLDDGVEIWIIYLLFYHSACQHYITGISNILKFSTCVAINLQCFHKTCQLHSLQCSYHLRYDFLLIFSIFSLGRCQQRTQVWQSSYLLQFLDGKKLMMLAAVACLQLFGSCFRQLKSCRVPEKEKQACFLYHNASQLKFS